MSALSFFHTYKFMRANGSFDSAAFERDQAKKKRKREQNAAALLKKRARFGCLTKSGAQHVTIFEEPELECGDGGADRTKDGMSLPHRMRSAPLLKCFINPRLA